jgi:hypothetical protein
MRAPVSHRTLRLLGLFATVSSLPLSINGCSYLERQSARAPTPDSRVQLAANERRFLRGSDLEDYTCPDLHLLTCEGASAVRSCTCVGY